MPIFITAREWDEARTAFSSSLMIDTPLQSLAQNLDGPEWPIPGEDETPAKYIYLSHREALASLAQKRQSPATLALLTEILVQTKAFDDPFGEMMQQMETRAELENPVLRSLSRLGIPEDFPIHLTALSAEARRFCRDENIATLGAFARIAQSMAERIIVGGDFRDLLNALSHVDELALARLIPFRPGAKGLHLVEAVGLLIRPLPFEQRMAIARGPAAMPDLELKMDELLQLFSTEWAELTAQNRQGVPLARFLVVLDDLSIESAALALIQHRLPREEAPAPAPAPDRARPSWFSRLLGRR